MTNANTYRHLLRSLLKNTNMLALMSLGRLAEEPYLYASTPYPSDLTDDSELIEAILESYLVDYDAVFTKLEYLRNQLNSTEELIMVRLDCAQNELLLVDMLLATFALVMTMASLPCDILGSNLESGIADESIWWFYGFVLFLVTFIICAYSFMRWYFKLHGNELTVTK